MIANLLPPLAHGIFRFILKRILLQRVQHTLYPYNYVCLCVCLFLVVFILFYYLSCGLNSQMNFRP